MATHVIHTAQGRNRSEGKSDLSVPSNINGKQTITYAEEKATDIPNRKNHLTVRP